MADTTGLLGDAMIDPVTGEIIDQKEVAERLLAQAREQGVSLTGPGGLLSQLTRNVLETALEAELTEHLGHEHGGTPLGEKRRTGTLADEVEARAERVRDHLRRTVRENHSLMKTAEPHTPLNGQTPSRMSTVIGSTSSAETT